MGRIYSTVFVSVHDVPWDTVEEYDFPDGFVYVVREVTCFMSNAIVSGEAQAYDENNVTWWQDRQDFAGPGYLMTYQGRQVFNGGDKLFLAFTTLSTIAPAVADWRVCGYKLSP